MIPYGRQSISEADIAAVVAVLRSDWLTQGPAVEIFEAALARVGGAPHAVSVNSATSALHIASLALGLGPGEALWTTPNTFVASANCGRYCGATVDFVDIDPRTANLDPERLAAKLRTAAKPPRVVVAVHFAGHPAPMAEIGALAERYGFAVIEDASHALGATQDGAPVGSGAHSHITVFSFHPVKIITTGEGGAALTRDPVLARRMQRLRSHGITRDANEMTAAPEGPWVYEQIELGYNYRLTDLQAALGTSQLHRLDDFLARRRALAARYPALLADLPLRLPPANADSAWHLYVVRLEDASRRAPLFHALRAAGIGVNVHYLPVHLQPYYRQLGFAPGDFPLAEDYAHRALTLPLHPGLSDSQQDFIAATLAAHLRGTAA